MRNKIVLDTGWKFIKAWGGAGTAPEADGGSLAADESGGKVSAPAGEDVTLPHTWNAVDGQDGGNDYYRGTCLYTRTLELSDILATASGSLKGCEVWLEFAGAAMTAHVWLNREHLACHEGGYSTFRVNLTDHLRETNLLAVLVDNSDNDRVYPQKADFTFYGGLYRHVCLVIVPKIHFALGYAGGPGIRVTPEVEPCSNAEAAHEAARSPEVEPCACGGSRARVTVETWLEGAAASDDCRVRFELDGQSETVQVRDGYATVQFIIQNAHLWDGVRDPYLYTVTAILDSENAQCIDMISTRFGCRTFHISPEEGFFLNGRSYPLRGVSRHQDHEGVGNALTPQMHREDMALIKEIGANTIRLAHYQHDQYFYDLCDAAGMIVWAEIPYITMHMPNGRENTLSQMRELIVQNYNHPSIVCWGLSNEITAAGKVTGDLLENHRLLNDLCHALDATRPTTMANVFMLETDSKLLEIPDLNSYNLYFGWYVGELEQNEAFFDDYHKTYPDRCIGFSEYGADANPGFQSPTPARGDYTESYQLAYHEHMLEMIEKRPYLWATHVWNMFDFAADGRDEGGRHGVNQKGLVTMDRRLKKDAFYLYKAHWSRESFVHICGRRYVDRPEPVTEVKVYSTLPQVSLFVDGELFETQTGKYCFKFHVPIDNEHEIRAVAGKIIDAGESKAILKGACSRDENSISCCDEIHIRKVAQPNPDYAFAKDGGVNNWFEADGLKDGYYSINDTLETLNGHPQAAAIVNRLMAGAAASRGDVAESVKDNPNLQKMLGRMKLVSLLAQAGDAVKPEQIKALNSALQQIKKQ